MAGEERERCEICDRDSKQVRLRKPLRGWVKEGLPQIICFDCFAEWSEGATDPEAIKARVLGGRQMALSKIWSG